MLEEETKEDELKLVEGIEMLVGDTLLELVVMLQLWDERLSNTWLDVQSEVPIRNKPFSFMRSLILVLT